MRWLLVALAIALVVVAVLFVLDRPTPPGPEPLPAGPAKAPRPVTTLEEFLARPESSHALAILRDYYEAEEAIKAGETIRMTARDAAMELFLRWLDETPESLGIDVRGKPVWVVELFDRARVDILARREVPRGQVEYIKVDNPRGLERLEYAVLLPGKYNAKNNDRYPLVVSLHERVINARHPAFRGGKSLAERSRVAIHNGWLKTPAADNVVVIAPTGNPNGFRFVERSHKDDAHVTFVTMGQGLTDFRTDWNRVFLEVHGSAVRFACEQAFMFAGIILRDREDEKRLAIPAEELFMLENLNGTPLLYIADKKTWARVGKPLSEAIAAAYAKSGNAANFILLQDNRDANGALKGDPKKIAAFVSKHHLPAQRRHFSWRYFNTRMNAPLPVQIGNANYFYDADASLEDKAGGLKFDVKMEKDGADKFVNIINIEITEAENLLLYLYDGLVNLSFPITVIVNGVKIHDKVEVKRNWEFFVTDILPRRYFMLPFVAQLECAFETKPQFVKPKKAANLNKAVKDNSEDGK